MSDKIVASKLDWIKNETGEPPKVSDTQLVPETFGEKFKRKVLENPFVPVGCFTTAGLLSYGLWAFKESKSELAQKMMRYRVAAQGLTIAAVAAGLFLAAKHLDNPTTDKKE